MLKLKRFSEGMWIDYPGAEGVRFLIRPLQLSQGLAIRSKVRKPIPIDVPTPGARRDKVTSLMEDVDTGHFTWGIFDYILQDFEGIGVEGEAEVSKDEIKKLIFDNNTIRDFILEKSEWLREQGDSKLEEERKN
jgi:hypothetical protein